MNSATKVDPDEAVGIGYGVLQYDIYTIYPIWICWFGIMINSRYLNPQKSLMNHNFLNS